jgi:hypothetical protein
VKFVCILAETVCSLYFTIYCLLLLSYSVIIDDYRLVDQTIQAAVGEGSLHRFADASIHTPPHKTPVDSGGPVDVVATSASSHKQQHHHRKRKERHESFSSQSQERKVIRYHSILYGSNLPVEVHHWPIQHIL